MEKRKYRIGQIAQNLNIATFVIRFWEKEFNIKSKRSQGGQRYYTEDDVQKFEHIKNLLYHHKLTIAGAKKHLLLNEPISKQLELFKIKQESIKEDFLAQIKTLKQKLIKLYDLLET